MLAGLVFVLAVLTDLVIGPRVFRRTRRDLAAGRSEGRVRLYRLILGLGWAFAAVAVTVLLIGGLSFAEIGFRATHLPGSAGSLFGGALVGTLVPVLLSRVSGKPPPMIGDIEVLLPGSRRERDWYAASAITAGITEEITYRALPLQLLLAVLPWTNRLPAVVLAAVAFGVAHRYQGWSGVVGTGFLGLLFGWIYLASGSLWPGMALHVVIDLRLLLIPRTSPAVEG